MLQARPVSTEARGPCRSREALRPHRCILPLPGTARKPGNVSGSRAAGSGCRRRRRAVARGSAGFPGGFEKLRKGLANVRKRSANFRKEFAKVRKTLVRVRKPLANVRKPFAKLRKSSANIRRSFADIRKRFADVRKTFRDVRKRFADVRKAFASIRKTFADLRKCLADTSRPSDESSRPLRKPQRHHGRTCQVCVRAPGGMERPARSGSAGPRGERSVTGGRGIRSEGSCPLPLPR